MTNFFIFSLSINNLKKTAIMNTKGGRHMFCDYHLHTEFSDDSDYLMEDVVKDAIEKGIEEICFTDHVDYGIKLDWDDPDFIEGKSVPNVNYPAYFQKIEYLTKKYYNKIRIKKGLEFGIQTHTIDKFKKLFDRYTFDFIILSIHQIEDKEFWTGDFQKNKTEDQYYQRYYQELYEVVKNYHDYSVIGHFDLIKRYDNKDGYSGFENNKEIITAILKFIIEDGKGIELNTSSIRYGLNDLMPSRKILKLYHDLGGRIITIGSDSHESAHLGAYIEEMKDELRKIGFKEFCTYKQMEPIFHKL